jgi:hypothetical protein
MFNSVSYNGRAPFVFTAAVLMMFFGAAESRATIVGAQSFGDEMVGTKIDVFFAQSGVRSALVAAGAPGQGVASVPGFFDFSVSGDTFLAEWQLTNTTTFDNILQVLFDTSGTTSPGSPADPGPHTPGILFDDNSLPSTLNGYAGRQGAVQVNVGAPFIIGSFEAIPWANASNLGDEFTQEEITYEAFRPGLTSVWRDDTDIVGADTGRETPEPTAALLAVIAGCGLMLRIRRR